MAQEIEVLRDHPAPALIRPESAAAGALKDIAFGSIAGMLGKVIEFPFDTVKVRLQSQPGDRPLRYYGPVDCFRQSIQEGGFRSLYRGISPPLAGAAAENASLFLSYSVGQNIARRYFLSSEYWEDTDKNLPLTTLVTCAALGGSFTSFVLTPIELIKCKMQVQAPVSSVHSVAIARPPGPITLIRGIIQAQGFLGMWHGQFGTFLRETGGSAAWFGAYEFASIKLRAWRGRDKTTSTDQMTAGALAGVSYNFFLFPADTIKSKMQTEAIGPRGQAADGFWAVGKQIYQNGGIPAFYRGCGITCIRSAPSSAIIFLCYESLRSYFS